MKIFIFIFLFSFSRGFAQTGDEDKDMFNNAKERDKAAIEDALNGWWTASMKTHGKRIKWWKEAKFGMFIHWGVYSLPGGEWKGKKVSGYSEHLMRKEKIARGEYLELAKRFDPVLFNAEQWILHARNAGMKYFIITAKHHDGFALFDSKFSDFDLEQTKFRKDPLLDLTRAAKKHGVKFGFYYSHAFDWEHPDAPGNDWEFNNPGGDKLLGGANWFDTHPEWLPKAKKYVDEKAIPQILELIGRYHPDILWFDTPHKLPLSENIRILKAIRAADPKIIVNGRLARNANVNFGDYKNTADRPSEFYPVIGDWEAIPTTNESYGFHRFDSSHKSVGHFIRLLCNAVSRGGNLLMNIGPKGDGNFDQKDVTILKGIGDWIKINRESVFNAGKSPLPIQSWGVSTSTSDKLYLHVFNWPNDGKLYVGGLRSTPIDAYLLGEKKQVLRFEKIDSNVCMIKIPANPPDTNNTVVVLKMPENSEYDSIRLIAPNVPTRLLAFDAEIKGNGLSFGDGKKDRYYVAGLDSKEKSLSWRFKTIAAQEYNAVIKYLAGPGNGGSYSFNVGLMSTIKQVKADSTEKVITEEIYHELSIPPGIGTISINPVVNQKREVLKLLEVQLIPVKQNK